MQDEEIRTVIARLARPHASGGVVVGRAALLAEGLEFAAIREWIIDHGGTPEASTVVAVESGRPPRGRPVLERGLAGGGAGAASVRAPRGRAGLSGVGGAAARAADSARAARASRS